MPSVPKAHKRPAAPALLFVDDDPDLRETMREALTTLGVERCLVAASLADVEAHRADALACSLAILDINLGQGEPSGVDVYRWLEQAQFGGHIVFLTGHGDTDPGVQEAVRLGSSRIVLKPVGLDALADLVAEASG